MSRRFAIALFVVATVGTVAACSLPTDHAPRAIERDRLPAILNPTQGPTTTIAEVGTAKDAQICFANVGDVQCVHRKVKDLTAAVLFETLVAGPTTAESALGFSSFIPPATELIGSSLDDHILRLNLSDAINDVNSPNNKTAYAQIVYSMIKSIPTVRLIAISVDGKATKIPTDTGPVDKAGLSDFATPPPTTVPPPTTGATVAAPTPSLAN